MSLDRLRELLSRWEEDDLSAGEMDELAGLLQGDPQARAEAVTQFLLSAQLVELLRQNPPATPATRRLEVGRIGNPSHHRGGLFRRRSLWWKSAGALAAAVLLVAVGGFGVDLFRHRDGQDFGRPGETGSEAQAGGVAVLTRSVQALWEPDTAPLDPGSAVPAGALKLKSGWVKLELYSGVTVVLEGPASVDLLATDRVRCLYGKLRAHVPPQARGFTVLSAATELVDQGTEFGMQVTPEGRAEVHVFQGRVDLYPPGSDRAEPGKREVSAGQGVRVDPGGRSTGIEAASRQFLSPAELEERGLQAAAQRQRRWLEASDRLRRDPRLIAYYLFRNQHPWDRTLAAANAPDGSRDGAIIGCEWVEGRWPGKQALEFKRPGDRVRINLPGKYASLTFAAWVRIDGLDHNFNGLLTTDSWGDGRPHWQLLRDERLSLTVLRHPGEHDQLQSPPTLGPGYLGQWTHLAAVYDQRAGTATHYVNGRAASTHAILYPCLLQIGPAEIGNWRAPASGHPNPLRNLTGRMDEFLLFNQALEAQEIQDLYQAGAPDS